MYYMRTGNYWWEQWFTIKPIDKPQTKRCPYCGWETIDINNKSGWFEQHLKNEHGITKLQYLQEHPEERSYFALVNKKLDRQMETDETKFVVCKICGEKLARIDTHHLKKHNITKLEYIEKYGSNNLSSQEYHEKQSLAAIKGNESIVFTKRSKDETEIIDYINSLGFDCRSDRKILHGKEIDIFIPEKNVAIEYNGNLWHSEFFGQKSKDYHVTKTNICEENGIHLLQIFEDEYANNKEIVLSNIKHILGVSINDYRITADNCNIKEIGKTSAEDFLNKNYVQGFVVSSVYLGCFYKDKLIAVMSFLDRGCNIWELTRCVVKLNVITQNVYTELLSYFTKKYKYNKIIGFADRRWAMNEKNMFTRLGFMFDEIVSPSYTYYCPKIDRYERFDKNEFEKHILSKECDVTDETSLLTTIKRLGYDRIWDCGTIKYVYVNPKYKNEENMIDC